MFFRHQNGCLYIFVSICIKLIHIKYSLLFYVKERAKLKKDLEERQKETKRVKSAKKSTEREISPTQKRKTSGKRNKSPHPKSPVQKNDQDDESIQQQQLRTKRTSNEFWPVS